MDFASKQERRSAENVVPLINIVFLLLIFFMLAGSFRPVEPFAVELPGAPASETEPPAREIPVLSVGASGELALDGRKLRAGELDASLAALSRDDSLQLRADAHLPARHLLPLLERLRDAGVAELDLVVSDAR